MNSLTMAEENRCLLATGVRAEDVGEEKIWSGTYSVYVSVYRFVFKGIRKNIENRYVPER